MASAWTVRIRGPSGQTRLALSPDTRLHTLYEQVAAELSIQERPFVLSNQPTGQRPFPATDDVSLGQAGIRHGDLLFVHYDRQMELAAAQSDYSARQHTTQQQAVDDVLDRELGLIARSRDPNLKPFDEDYMRANKIKHLSFQSYLRKLSGKNKQQQTMAVEEVSFVVDPHCDSGHPPYPASMCAKCQPGAIILQQQTYRMVDHVEFESPGMVDEFISYWRKSGLQRFGFLFGRYERHDVVPLGVKAVVSVIVEPAQKGAVDGIELATGSDHESFMARVQSLATRLSLYCVGMVYTDLLDDGTRTGKVLCRRHAKSFFVSSAECLFLARMQSLHPNKCRHSKTGVFGSKFVTVVISGDAQKDIHLSAYQISNIGAAMVRDQVIDATSDPALCRVQTSDANHYVPEVFYKYKNEYNVVVQEAAKPTFPVEYLLVTLTEGFPQQPNPKFSSAPAFPVENREPQSLGAIRKVLRENASVANALSDFHLLLYIHSLSLFSESDFESLIQMVRTKPEHPDTVLATNASWQTLLTVAEETEISKPESLGAAGPTVQSQWSCPHCTFSNTGSQQECAMCGLPRQ